MKLSRAGTTRLVVAGALVAVLALTTGCSGLKKLGSRLLPFGEKPVETEQSLAAEALDAFERGRYDNALDLFGKIKDLYPFGQYSLMAELKSADSEFYQGHFQEALVLYQEFEDRHPTNEAIPYVMYQIGSCHFKRIGTIDRDISGAQHAIAAYTRLLKAFPASPYTEETRKRIALARDFLAAHEFYVADFYVKTREYEQAQERLAYLLATYPEAEAAGEAEQLLAALKAGNPPKRSWRSWLPSFSFSEWTSLSGWGLVAAPTKTSE